MPVSHNLPKKEENYCSVYETISDSNDAVHPLFKRYEEEQKDEATSTCEDFRCKECDEYFPKGNESVADHFSRTHMPVDSCVYCEGPVCEYFDDDVRLVYHNCSDVEPKKDVRSNGKSIFSSVKNKLNTRGNGCDLWKWRKETKNKAPVLALKV